MTKRLTIFMLALWVSGGLFAQHHEKEQHAPTENHHLKHKLAVYGGFTKVDASFVEHETGEVSTGKWVPTLGVDYFYSLSSHFALGMIADLELDSYYVKDHSAQGKHFERINVLVLTPVLKYSPIHSLGIIAGGGLEFEFVEKEEPEHFAVLKLGLEYEVPMHNGWELTPSIMFDVKEKYSTSSLGISLGKRF